MKSRLCSLLLAFSMVLSMAVVFTFPAAAEETVENTAPATAPAVKTDFSDIPANAWWDGSVDTEFEGEGTAENPYKISSAAELAGLAELTKVADTVYHTSHFELVSDIYINDPTPYLANWNADVSVTALGKKPSYAGNRTDFVTKNAGWKDDDGNSIAAAPLTFTPTFSAGKFQGTFDGGNHTIFGFSVFAKYSGETVALIRTIGKNANIKNLNMAYAAMHVNKYSGNSSIGTFVGQSSGDNVFIENCHAMYCNIYGNVHVSGMVGSVGGGTITFIDSTFNGNVYMLNESSTRNNIGGFCAVGAAGSTINIHDCAVYGSVTSTRGTGSYGNSNVGGFIGVGKFVSNNILITNSVNYATVKATKEGIAAGGFVSSLTQPSTNLARTERTVLINCINYGDVISELGPAGGIVGHMNMEYSNVGIYGIYAYNIANYGDISGVSAGQVVGLYGVNNSEKHNPDLHVENCVLAGNATGTTAGGSVIGVVNAGILDRKAPSSSIDKHLVLHNVYVKESGPYFGKESEEMIAYAQTDSEFLDVSSLNMAIAQQVMNDNKVTNDFSDEYPLAKWTVYASEIQAASLQLSDSIGINLYAEIDSLSFVGWSKVAVNGSKALDSIGTAKINGKDYLHYQHNVNPAEIGDTFTYTINGKSIEYGVETYATRKYNNGSENLNQLLEAILQYGDAARVNKGIEAKSMAAIGKTYDANAIDTAYESVNISPAEGGNDQFTAASLNLDGHINLLLKVAGEVKKVSVTYQYTDTEGNVQTSKPVVVKVVNGEAVYEGIVATALNLQYHLVALGDVDDDGVDDVLGEMDWNVSRFIQNGLNSESFNENQATLAKALALYMQSARIYTGLDEAAE